MNFKFKMYQIRQSGAAVVGHTDDDNRPLFVHRRPDGWWYDDVDPITGDVVTFPCSALKARKLLRMEA